MNKSVILWHSYRLAAGSCGGCCMNLFSYLEHHTLPQFETADGYYKRATVDNSEARDFSWLKGRGRVLWTLEIVLWSFVTLLETMKGHIKKCLPRCSWGKKESQHSESTWYKDIQHNNFHALTIGNWNYCYFSVQRSRKLSGQSFLNCFIPAIC